ncbi:MAG: rhodanese-like domain-containing protein [Acidobacteria bacterium]|nr:rhodanese-like domain-containing protein [Acidobacteriota bacterium]
MKLRYLVLFAIAALAIGCGQSPAGNGNNSAPAANANANKPAVNNTTAQTPAASGSNTTAATENKGPYPDVPRITVADAKKDFDAGTAVFIDTHSKVMFDNEHIKGAINIPFNEMESHIDLVPKGKKIIAYCSCPAENTSAAVGHFLLEKGFSNVYALVGGNNAWKTAGHPMEKKAAK